MSSTDTGSALKAPIVRVFTIDGSTRGGNPAPVWLDADQLTTSDMQALARASGHEAAFVCRADDGTHRWHMRYFVPNHEMEMCGHATIAALWLLHARGAWAGEPIAIRTASGAVRARKTGVLIEITQPRAVIQPVDVDHLDQIARCLNIPRDEIVGGVLNASTSRPKTLIQLRHAAALHALNVLQIEAAQLEALCERIGSTGLYPFVFLEDFDRVLCSARQFPKSSGYPEDPATGIAAAALAWGLRELGLVADGEVTVTIRQGEAMGSPSRIIVKLPSTTAKDQFCWIGGEAVLQIDVGMQA